MSLAEIVSKMDDFVWGPVMLILLVGTGIFLTIRLKFRLWRNLGYALKSTLSKEARTKAPGPPATMAVATPTIFPVPIVAAKAVVKAENGDTSPSPRLLVWMWISACFGLTSKFSECMLAISTEKLMKKVKCQVVQCTQ